MTQALNLQPPGNPHNSVKTQDLTPGIYSEQLKSGNSKYLTETNVDHLWEEKMAQNLPDHSLVWGQMFRPQ